MCKILLKEPTVIQLFEKSCEILGYDLLRLCLEGPVEELNMTQNCQPAVVVASLAALQSYYAKDNKVNFLAQKEKKIIWVAGFLNICALISNE